MSASQTDYSPTDAQTLIVPKRLRTAVLGSGAREHALAWKIAQSTRCESLMVVPGNAGMAAAGINCAAPEAPGSAGVAALLKAAKIDFVVIGPDDLLAEGYADDLEKAGFKVFGPSKKASKLEWSKSFAKEVMLEAGVPTARSHRWDNIDDARVGLANAVRDWGGYPLVLKYDGLALGKGVVIAEEESTALAFLTDVFESGKFQRGTKNEKPVVICEEFLVGHEVSVFALCDGKTCAVLEAACDHKRLLDGNRGPNTGGMGAFSPVPWLAADTLQGFGKIVFQPVLDAMAAKGTPFRGLLYAGLMMKGDEPRVLEFNARFGDPETQALLPRLDSDLLVLLYASATGELGRALDHQALSWSRRACINVVAASEGYPEKPVTGRTLKDLDRWVRQHQDPATDALVFFAGVKEGQEPGSWVTGGGRVLGVSAMADTLELARARAYEVLGVVTFEGRQLRRDVGLLHG